jgi:pentatricopeptide repeat protein
MDAYGIIEPVDIESMEKTFKALQMDSQVEIQGNHFSTLINAYGCVQKDLNKAIEIFDSIPSYPRVQLDAVVFEAMINALVAHRRTDLIPEYISKMNAAGVHMTAYIANFLIKGYAMVGDMEHARSIFESLVDPPEGMAAPNNHVPHETASSSIVDHTAPVYREVN